eukprot:4586712-Pleurochrysis_carterae.AAC.1
MSGGYAAVSLDVHFPSTVLLPPHCLMWEAWVQRSVEKCASFGATPGVTNSVVNFWVGAPSAHWGKSPVGWMFKYVLGAGVASGRKNGCCATYDLVGLGELAGVSGVHIRKA